MLYIVQELVGETFVWVVDEFTLKLDRSYWVNQLLLVDETLHESIIYSMCWAEMCIRK